MLLVMISVVLPAAFWSTDFYRLWIGGKYLSGVPYQQVAVLFQILLVSVVTDNSSNIAGQILVGSGRVRTLAILLLCGSIVNVSASLVLIRWYGLVGLAAATVLASVVVDLIAMPIVVQRHLGLPVVTLIRSSFGRPVAVAVLQAAFLFGVRFAGRPARWPELIGQGMVAVAGSTTIVLWFGVTASERERFFSQPLRRLLGGHVVARRQPSIAPATCATVPGDR
jgi:hypothetical protein